MRRPPPLGPGARVALVAPSGPLRGEDDLDRAIANTLSLGWEPVIGQHVLDRAGYFAGTDAARLADLNAAAGDDTIDAIWCIRGGYGAGRLLPGLDLTPWRTRAKALIGFSDITALHLALGREAELVTYHGPTARGELGAFSRDSFVHAIVKHDDPCGEAVGARTLVAGRARGRLAGGNLAVLTSLCGTHFAPSFNGCIVVLEDVNEAVYRIDRMLLQLRLSGALEGCAGLAFGAFTDAPREEPGGGERSLDDVLAECAELVGVPCVTGIPVGHIPDQWTIPLGAPAELDADARTLHVTR